MLFGAVCLLTLDDQVMRRSLSSWRTVMPSGEDGFDQGHKPNMQNTIYLTGVK